MMTILGLIIIVYLLLFIWEILYKMKFKSTTDYEEWPYLFYLLLLLKMYLCCMYVFKLKGRVTREKEKEGGYERRSREGKTIHKHTRGRAPSTWFNFLCPSRHLSRKLDQKEQPIFKSACQHVTALR